MTTIVQVEFRQSLLSIREDILHSLGHPVISVLGSRDAFNLVLSDSQVGVVVIGHRASRQERCDLIVHFRKTLPSVPIMTLLGRLDPIFGDADFNCPADDPPLWVRTVSEALAGIS